MVQEMALPENGSFEGIEAAPVWLDDIQYGRCVPFGATKESELGREKGRYDIESYLAYKRVV